MQVTSDTLFHFTNTFENLENILKEKFYLTYCREDFILGLRKYSNYFPMISLCDIPLFLAQDQFAKYGSYAIGLSKQWGIRHKLNPVLYVESNSTIAKDINNSRDELLKLTKAYKKILETRGNSIPFDQAKSLAEGLNQFSDNYINTLRYIKNYQGTLVRKDKVYPNYRFYDEREWRYVPEYQDKRLKPHINKEEYDIYRGTESKPFIKPINIAFSGTDIKYLIVKSRSEIPRLIRVIKSTDNLVSNSDQADILTTHIISVEDIKHDF